MTIAKIRWSNLLKLTELDFRPDFPAELSISDEVLQVISWLTATTGFDRRLLRCTKQGALLVAKAWSALNMVNNYELGPAQTVPDVQVIAGEHKGILVTTSTEIVLMSFIRVLGGDAESVYVPPAEHYWYPHSCYSVTATTVPAATGTASIVGLTTFN